MSIHKQSLVIPSTNFTDATHRCNKNVSENGYTEWKKPRQKGYDV